VRGFVNGIVFTLAVLIAGTFVGIWEGVFPSGADVKPSRLERWVANRALNAQIGREDQAYVNPLQPTDANLIDGVHVFAATCAGCHGAADGEPSTIAKGMYIHAPQLAKRGVEDDSEQETFWKVDHGIRFTAMPAFGKTLSEDDEWKVTMFVKRMNALPPAVQAVWAKVPSSAATPNP